MNIGTAPILRGYQVRLEDAVRSRMRDFGRILAVLATGGGKTVLFADIARKAAIKGNKVLILAHRDQLIKQASRKLLDTGLQHGIIMAGFTANMRLPVQIASVQTLVRRVDRLVDSGVVFDLIIIDEAHLSSAASYLKIVEAWPKARVLGVTGSPVRLDGKGLGRASGGLFDTIEEGVSISQLIDDGYLVRPCIYASREKIDLSGVKVVGGDYDSSAVADLMDKPKITGSAIESWRTHCNGVPAVAWCANVAHAEHVAKEFCANGIPAVALSGESSSEERDKALKNLSNGSIKVITFAMLLVEGVDCPAIGAVILLRPTMSLSSYLQVIGRGLRPIYAQGMALDTRADRMQAIDAGPKGGKCFVLDHCDLWRKHGTPDEDREWSLDGAKKKKGKKKDPDTEKVPDQCPQCFHVFPSAPICPSCGHVMERKVRKIEEVDGELVEITQADVELLRAAKKKEVGAARTIEELREIGIKRKYSPYWAEMIMEARRKGSSARA